MTVIQAIINPPIVGKKYLIPCIKYKDGSPWIPTRGEKHADESELFSSSVPHYHVDWRFAGSSVLKYFELKLNFDDLNEAPLIVLPVSLPEHQHQLKSFNKTCLREELEYPISSRERLWGVVSGTYKRVAFREELYKIYKGETLQQENLCPHRGYKMDDVQTKCKNHKVCPLHGLTFGVQGQVIRPE